MRRVGLVAKKIMIQGKRKRHLNTYWVRPGGSMLQAQMRRLAAAKHPDMQEKVARQHAATHAQQVQTHEANVTTAAAHLLATPAARRAAGTALDPKLAPPKLNLTAKSFDHNPLSGGALYPGNVGKFITANHEQFLRMGNEIDRAFVNSHGTKRMESVPDRMMSMALGENVQGSFNSTTGDMMVRASVMTKMLTPVVNKQSPTQEQTLGGQIWTHEQLHAASNKERPQSEPLGTAHSPHRWIEESTTELLSHPYNAQVMSTLTGSAPRKANPLVHELTLDGGVEVQVGTEVSYREQCMRFANLAGYIAGVKGSDSIDDINRAVLHHAAEVKKRGTDRYEYLANEVLKAHGVKEEDNPALHKEAKEGLTRDLKVYMGQAMPSAMYGEGTGSVQALVTRVIRHAYEDTAPEMPVTAATPTFVTPLAVASAPVPQIQPPVVGAQAVPKVRAGRRSTLKKRL